MLSGNRGVAGTKANSSANGDIRVAIVGLRGKGEGHVDEFRRLPGVRVAALCDVDSTVLAKYVKRFTDDGEQVMAYADYRKLLEDPSIDAVVIVTPNHWHALMTVWACQAGKDVYVEKPVSHNVWEGRQEIEAARKYNRIVQAGMQSRSDEALHEAFAHLKAGNLGQIKWARGLCYKLRENIGWTSGPQPIPPGIDYDLWSGPAPLVPPRRNTSNGTVHYDWHWFWNYGGGDIANQGAHEMDMCRWALGQGGLPPSVMSIGGRFGNDDAAETPNTQITVFGYEPAPLIFEVRGLPHKAGVKAMDAYRGIRIGLVVQCEGGYFAGGAGGGGIFDNQGKKIKQFSGPGGGGHQANFIKAVRSRRISDLAAPIECGHLSSTLSHLANISYRLGRNTESGAIREAVHANEEMTQSHARMVDHLESNNVTLKTNPATLGPLLQFQADRESFVTGERYDLGYWANTHLRREYRRPFVLPEIV